MADLNKKILIVDDTKSYLFILSETLRDAGFIVSFQRRLSENEGI